LLKKEDRERNWGVVRSQGKEIVGLMRLDYLRKQKGKVLRKMNIVKGENGRPGTLRKRYGSRPDVFTIAKKKDA